MSEREKADWGTAGYWQERFEGGDSPWELGHPSSALFEAFEQVSSLHSLHGKTVLSPGCGTGSDAIELVRRGAHVIAVDWTTAATSEIEKRYAQIKGSVDGSLEVRAGDLFALPPQQVDLVAEHTFFCAIDPSHRLRYAERIAEWLPQGGLLVGNFFVVSSDEASCLPHLSLTQKGEGPPFATTEDELRGCLAPYFTPKVLRRALKPELTRREGMEWVGIFERR